MYKFFTSLSTAGSRLPHQATSTAIPTVMSNSRITARRKRSQPAITPMIGSLLRLPHEVIVARMLAALNAKGFDISATELGVFL